MNQDANQTRNTVSEVCVYGTVYTYIKRANSFAVCTRVLRRMSIKNSTSFSILFQKKTRHYLVFLWSAGTQTKTNFLFNSANLTTLLNMLSSPCDSLVASLSISCITYEPRGREREWERKIHNNSVLTYGSYLVRCVCEANWSPSVDRSTGTKTCHPSPRCFRHSANIRSNVSWQKRLCIEPTDAGVSFIFFHRSYYAERNETENAATDLS